MTESTDRKPHALVESTLGLMGVACSSTSEIEQPPNKGQDLSPSY